MTIKSPPQEFSDAPMMNFCRFLRQKTGAALTELAIILPFMILLIFGIMELSSVYEIKRRLAQIDTTLGDLMGRTADITDNEVLDILVAAEMIMVPYSLRTLEITLTAIQIDEDGQESLLWSRSSSGEEPSNVSIALPSGLGSDKHVIRVDTSYETSIDLAFIDVADITLGTQAYIVPRTADVSWNGSGSGSWSGTGWTPPEGSPEDQEDGSNSSDDESDAEDSEEEDKKDKKDKRDKRDKRS